ncbi:MAG: hypothetical protein M3068_07030 [Gemmatimonadota bacterium]|nr:hypothetical protein [Gemmatimonadota bacterium]
MSRAFPFALLLLALAAGTESAAAQDFSFIPGTARYRITAEQKISQEMMGQKQEASVNTTEMTSVILSQKTKDTLQFTITFDSIGMTTGGAAPPMDVSNLKGSSVVGTMSTRGKIYDLKASVTSATAPQITESFRHFFVMMPKSVKAGQSWTDTTESKTSAQGMDITTTVVVNSTLVGDTTYGGQKAWKIQRNSTVKLAGAGNGATLDGLGTGSGMYYVGPHGVYFGGSSTQESNATVTVASQGLLIPIVTHGSYKVEMIK